MAQSKQLKADLRSALKQGFTDRGWRAVRGNRTGYQAPEAIMSPPLALRVDPTIETNKFGDVTLTATAVVQDDEIVDLLLGFDRASMPSHLTRFPGEAGLRGSLTLGLRTTNSLLNPVRGNHARWEISAPEDLPSTVDAFFAMVDGPLAEWAAQRRTPGQLLDCYGPDSDHPYLVGVAEILRALATLALLQDQPEFARKLIAHYTFSMGDDADRLAAFERELAERFPAYGPLQRS